MSDAKVNTRRLPALEVPGIALSPAAAAVSANLAAWRGRISETQTLLRLTLSLLKSAGLLREERRTQLGRLIAIEQRALSHLPRVELSQLRSTTNARESGIDLRGPDVLAAELYFERLRTQAAAPLQSLAREFEAATARPPRGESLETAQRALEELGRVVELVETMLHPRLNDPTVPMRQALERAAATRAQGVLVDGEGDAGVQQVRGLMRFLSEVIASVGGQAYAHVRRDAGWVYVSIARNATVGEDQGVPRDQRELLRMAGYLLRVAAELDDGAWRLAFVARDAG